MTKRILALLALTALLGPLAGWAQPKAPPAQVAGASCHFKDRLTFAEGKSACLSDYTLGQQRPVGYSSAVRELLMHVGRYAVAVSGGHPTCPMVLTLAQADNNNREIVSGARRDSTALIDCKNALSRVSATADCQCEIVILDGTVTARKDDFDQRFLREELKPAQAVAQTPAPKPLPEPSALQPEPPRNELLESLQKRLAELEAARATGTPVAAGSAPRLSARALVIGNSRYVSFGALANPARDAQAIAAKFRSFGFEVGATADDGDGQNSPYTTALLRHLDTPSDISLVLRQVRQTVLQLTGGRQEPWEYGSLVGEQIVLPLLAR